MPRCSNLQRERGQAAYQNDAFRMWDFKVKICPRNGPHDWTQCPFAHTGEKAKRRDLQQFVYSGNPCSEFEKSGVCPRGDLCPQAHGVFESWLHPLRYRTKLCKEGTACTRRVCFFAHNSHELRHLESGFQDASTDHLIRAFPEPNPYELLRQAGPRMQGGLSSLQGNQGDIINQRAQMRAASNATGMNLNCLSAAQLRWLAACIASMPQQPQLQMQGMGAGNMDMPLHERSLANSSMTDDDPIRADLSHGIMPSPGILDTGSSYFDSSQLSPHSLGTMGMPAMAPNMGVANGHGPMDMPHVRQDPQSAFSPQSSFNQGFMGAPDWSTLPLVMSNGPGPYMNNHSFDLDMWN
ncbi:hypothetical protein WJX74_007573 [Apatococcus lobatus]|uniref:C3H1-type domain-containing protein n=1 Tax=Apatococcus lobatus TaxID=904363 RepID=A0AAW1RDQ1_9CHLO